ncbi:O-fucosyltransferase family protein [Marivivens aquimaris]|uniref:hypothetical protein n=1 Tax=Marivivens aquimaris TaxID=2774876 RepID=UPI00187F5781|nr:hypothetical protein [Marivivens aquimaris]
MRRPFLFIDVQHGLCNRLRALASAEALAEQTGRELVVIWRTDAHCEARIGDLLDYSGMVIETDEATAIRQSCEIEYNYMEAEENSCHLAPVFTADTNERDRDVYLRSAYSLVSPKLSFDLEQEKLRAMRPSRAVLDLMEPIQKPNDMAVHIRMAGGQGFEHLEYESPKNWPAHRHEELQKWRQQSNREKFIARIRELENDNSVNSIFLAADTPETYAAFADEFGNKLVTVERTLYDRSAIQIQYALADLLMLTTGRHFLGSPWSSFTDVAQRLAGPGRPMEVSGLDF